MTSHCSTCRHRTSKGYCRERERMVKGNVRDCRFYEPKVWKRQMDLEALL